MLVKQKSHISLSIDIFVFFSLIYSEFLRTLRLFIQKILYTVNSQNNIEFTGLLIKLLHFELKILFPKSFLYYLKITNNYLKK